MILYHGTAYTKKVDELEMAEKYYYRVVVSNGKATAIQKGNIITQCSETTIACDNSKICTNCGGKGEHNINVVRYDGGVGNYHCYVCGYQSTGRSVDYARVYCGVCHAAEGGSPSNVDKLWIVRGLNQTCHNCGATGSQSAAKIVHTCSVCQGKGATQCTVHNKYGEHYYCSHSTAGVEHE